MKIIETEVKGVYIIEPKPIGDSRGWFVETFREDKMKESGLTADFVQENHSFSATKGTLRGLHFQNFPRAQTKLLRCTRGAVLDVAVDLRKDSPTYKKHVVVELSEENKKQLYIPRGCAHGFLTLCENCEVQYKVDDYYSPKHDRSIRFDDPDFAVNWGGESGIISSVQPCSDNDNNKPSLASKDANISTQSLALNAKKNAFVLSDKDKNAPLFADSDANFDARVLVTGAKGQLGTDVVDLLKKRGINHIGADFKDFDITDENATDKFIDEYKPTIIVHCAAFTAVDKAETEKELCRKINMDGSKNIAVAAAKVGAKVVYLSSDYVYGGTGDMPLVETDICAPNNYYAETKLLGEGEVARLCDKHFILRASWIFGEKGNNFVKTMQRLSAEGKDIAVISDQIGSPTYTKDLAVAILDIMFSDKYGIYNVSNEGFCSWADFAEAILGKSVKHIKSNEYKSAAARPLNSRLAKDKLENSGFNRLPAWQDALDRYRNEK